MKTTPNREIATGVAVVVIIVAVRALGRGVADDIPWVVLLGGFVIAAWAVIRGLRH